MKKSVCVIGHFDWSGNSMIGATVKARNILVQLEKKLSPDYMISNVDIFGWKKQKNTVLLSIIKAFCRNERIVLVISETRGKILILISLLKYIFHNKISFCVVGGDIDKNIADNPRRKKGVKCIDKFFVETEKCRRGLRDVGITNVDILKNFKILKPLSNVKNYTDTIYRFCIFSRITEEKGVSDAIKAIDVLSKKGFMVQLDIYGMISPEYEKEFWAIIQDTNCKYCGCVDAKKSVSTISEYYCLLFPTRFDGEGMPGTIIDAFAAGIPIICSDWKYRAEMIQDNVNGLVYPYKQGMLLIEKMEFAINNKKVIDAMRKEALLSYDLYRPEVAIQPLINWIKAD